MSLKNILEKHQIRQRALADALGLSPATINNIVSKNLWPKTPTKSELIASITQFLTPKGVSKTDIDGIFTPTKSTSQISNPKEEEAMYYDPRSLDPKTKRQFGLFTNPFTAEIQSADEIYSSTDTNYVRHAMIDTINNGGFRAIIGESGAGKTTLKEGLIDRIYREKQPVIVIQPFITSSEDTDAKGKLLKANDIIDAIIYAITPNAKIKRTNEAKNRQLAALLLESHLAGYRHVLIIEEAHCLPKPTLKQLKRFREIKLGFTPLISILLIGQTELQNKLSFKDPEVREVVQRCEIVTLDPLTQTGLADYLSHRLKPTGKKLSDIIDESGLTAIAKKLGFSSKIGQIAHSRLYPLAIGNLLTRAMNLAAELGVPVVTADVVSGV